MEMVIKKVMQWCGGGGCDKSGDGVGVMVIKKVMQWCGGGGCDKSGDRVGVMVVEWTFGGWKTEKER